MSRETVLTNARIVLSDRVLDGTVVMRDDRIADVAEGASQAASAQDLDGDLLLPGLVELHTDNLERHFLPRPGVVWPEKLSAAMAHDTQVVGAGITTVFDALSVGDYHAGGLRRDIFDRATDAVCAAADIGLFRAEHFLHMRCEVSDPAMPDMFEPWVAHPLVRFVSVMDHTPGQRQWTKLEKFREHNSARGWSDQEVAETIDAWKETQQRHAGPNRTLVLELCRPRGLPVASHDDTTEQHIAEAVADGLAIAEFPTTLLAARAARDAGLRTLMGAPNVVRGGSHSGNVSALDLADDGLLDGLSSDYVPASLLHAAFLLADRPDMDLPAAIALVTVNPARMAGLEDRGTIAAGQRADLVRARRIGGVPLIRTVWRSGERVF